MILGDVDQTFAAATPEARATLDDLFRRAVHRHPERIALVDPPNRAGFTDGAPQRLTYAQADRIVSAIAERLRDLNLPLDAIVGIQLPNTVENVLTLLGVLRAGLIAAPLPLLWRRGDLVAALGRVGARALITCRHVGATDHAALAMQAAADIFPIRYVCAYGTDLPDGVVAFDDLLHKQNPHAPALLRAHDANRAAHLALITWEAAAESIVPVARNHAEVVAGGLAVLLEGRFDSGATFLSAIPPSSFAGLAVGVVPWLIAGGTLTLHQPFDPDALAQQLREGCDSVVLPAPVVPRLADAGFFASNTGTVMGLWRAPERLATATSWLQPTMSFIDVACLGETCIIPMRRAANGKPAALALGSFFAPQGAPGAVAMAELQVSRHHTLVLSGPMVPQNAYPPGAERSELPYFKTVQGVVDTGYPCYADPATRKLAVSGPPVGVAGVGGYRFLVRELQRLIADIDSGGHITALPDSLAGHRLAGNATDKNALRNALLAQGVNPLVADAFAA